jgi:cytochrome c-type biogenesis protein CcmH
MTAGKRWNRMLKRWWGWAVLFVAVVAVVTVAAGRERGPQTQQDRIEAVAARLACPTCDGESVEVSRAPAAVSIRNEIARQVIAGQLSDDQIVAEIEASFGGRVLLVPRATGLDALVWVLPVTVAMVAVAALAMTFRRWRREADALAAPTDEDRALVANALAHEHGEDPSLDLDDDL